MLSITAICCSLISFMFALKASKKLEKARQYNQKTEKPPKYIIPQKGIFTVQPKTRKPKYWTDEMIWEKEQDEKRRR